jgi:hypothetical protein
MMTDLTLPGTPAFHSVLRRFGEDADGLHLRRTQYVPDEYLEELRMEREDNRTVRAGDLHRVGSVPAIAIEEMHAEGFDYVNAPIEDILLWMRLHGYDEWITSNKL